MKTKSNTELLKYYNEDYVKFYAGKTTFRLARLIKYMKLNINQNVVDFACGNGLLMELVAPKVKSYIGIDFSELFIKAAKEKKEKLSINNADFICSDIIAFCQNNIKRFDIDFAMDFTEHVPDDELSRILENIRKSIKPNGKFYIHTPNAKFIIEIMKNKKFYSETIPGTHCSSRSGTIYASS